MLQVRKLDQTPFILVGAMWQELVRWVEDQFLQNQTPMIDPADVSIPQCVENYEDAIAILQTSHQRWQQLATKA